MVRRTDPSEDVWHNVTDAKKRKKIQDRLAQRARRQRLRQAKIRNSESSSSPEQQSDGLFDLEGFELETAGTSSGTSKDVILELSAVLDPKLHSSSASQELTNYYSIPTTNKPLQFATPSPGSELQLTPFLTVFSALFINGEIQGLQCSTTHSSRTPEATPSLPLPLHPTMTQRLVMHPRWIDRLPFPRMRDSLIKLQGVINEEELIRDLFTMPSWTIVEGGASWDPRGWMMEEFWAKKWGWLMF